MLLVQSYDADLSRVARHLQWSESKVQAAVNYAESFPGEIQEALSENDSVDLETLRHMAPQTADFVCRKRRKG
jgi:hypothetical protein